METKHILICGPRGVGKSTLINTLIRQCRVPVYGFVTRSTPRDADGFHEIYIHHASETQHFRTPDNHIGNCNGRERTVNTDVFNRVGVPMLRAQTGGIIFMDELGFMESEATAFQKAVINCLDSSIPVIASVKERYDVSFLNTVRAHPNVKCYMITEENRDYLLIELSKILEEWMLNL